MPTDLTTPEITYGNFSFGTGPRVNSHVELAPEYDKSGRVIVAVTYTIYVRALITSDDGIQKAGPDDADDSAEDVVKKLERELMIPGQVLQYSGWGHGDFAINAGPNNMDIAFGPKPRHARVEMIGGTGVMQVDWAVDVTINRCDANGTLHGKIGDLKSVTYTETYSIDERGLTRHSVNGELTITNNRGVRVAGGNGIARHVDEYRQRFHVNLPFGFKRVRNEWVMSEDKSTVQINIVDEEMPSPEGFPPGVTNIKFDHESDYRFGRKPNLYQGTMSGYVDVVKTVPLGSVWIRILIMMRTRLDGIRYQGTLMIISLRIREEVFNHRIGFGLTYWLTPESHSFATQAEVNSMFSGSGSTDNVEWYASMAETAYHTRGVARMGSTAGELLINPCNQGLTTIAHQVFFNETNIVGGSLTNILPTRERSYLLWDNWLEVDSEPRQFWNNIMPARPANILGSAMLGVMNLGGVGVSTGIGSKSGSVTQIGGSNTVIVTLKGKAARFGFQVELPSLIELWDNSGGSYSTENNRLVPVHCKNSSKVHSEIGGVLIYLRKWVISYKVHFDSPEALQDVIQNGFVKSMVETPQDSTGHKILRDIPVQ